ncbi:hypothetical protein EW145_g558 [Phellinidium pouzarii]|uniref:Plasma membrane fusion protein PRM1 n=1 Tax=Phellinidium pouzarii TaxID=167371 RepID=A0A4S4LHV0_9AGAM|nr:hypothetical protein EW145_g558 [Phellinidium pouzarii]
MLFNRVVSFVTFFLSINSFTLANPVEKRGNAEIENVLTTLQSSTDIIMPQIKALVTNGNTSDTTVTPLINQLVETFSTARDSLLALNTGTVSTTKRQSANDIANLSGNIIEEVAQALKGLAATTVPSLSLLLSSVDIILDEFLVALEIDLSGVLTLISSIFVGISALLYSVGLPLTALLLDGNL